MKIIRSILRPRRIGLPVILGISMSAIRFTGLQPWRGKDTGSKGCTDTLDTQI
jgi:hypothetical protein